MANPDGTSTTFSIHVPTREDTANRDMSCRARKAWGWQKKQFAKAKGLEYLNAQHSYALMRGDIDTGRRWEMLGREAKLLNEDYELKFINGKTPRLYRWKFLRPPTGATE